MRKIIVDFLLSVGIGVVAVVVFALGSDTRVAMRGSMFARSLNVVKDNEFPVDV